MKGIPEEYISNKVFDIEFTKSSLFKEYKEIELREALNIIICFRFIT